MEHYSVANQNGKGTLLVRDMENANVEESGEALLKG